MNDQENAVVVKDLYKSFMLPHEQYSGIKQAFVNIFNRKAGYETQHALKNISFEVKKGEFFGIVGRNGSGKSTLLKLLAGIYAPDKGLVQVNGSLTPFIELGVGFNPELTGRENVFLNGALLGFDRKEMEAMYNEIVEFAELEKFMDQTLKNYSSGMQVRLAFSIAVRAKSDILLIDEVLAVGDAAFQTKCFDYFYQLKETNTTVIFVSHDRASLERFCSRGILVDNGVIVSEGTIQKVLKNYSSVVLEELGSEKDDSTHLNKPKTPQLSSASIKHTYVKDKSGNIKRKVTYGEELHVSFEVNFKQLATNLIFGVTIWQKNVNKPIFATNTLIEGISESGSYLKGDTVIFQAKLPDLLNDGEYYVEPAIANESGTVFLDQVPQAFTFFISGSNNPHSVISATDSIKLSKK